MSDQPRRPLSDMIGKAQALVTELTPYCLHPPTVAGSIRRERPMVSDIELLAVPKIEEQSVKAGLFPAKAMANQLDLYLRTQLEIGHRYQPRLDKNNRPALGDRYMRLMVDGHAVDVFAVLEPAQFGVLLLIRTGPAEFSRKFVTQRKLGGWLPDDCIVRDGAVWRGDGVHVRERLAMPHEAEFFGLCGRTYLSPKARTA